MFRLKYKYRVAKLRFRMFLFSWLKYKTSFDFQTVVFATKINNLVQEFKYSFNASFVKNAIIFSQKLYKTATTTKNKSITKYLISYRNSDHFNTYNCSFGSSCQLLYWKRSNSSRDNSWKFIFNLGFTRAAAHFLISAAPVKDERKIFINLKLRLSTLYIVGTCMNCMKSNFVYLERNAFGFNCVGQWLIVSTSDVVNIIISLFVT